MITTSSSASTTTATSAMQVCENVKKLPQDQQQQESSGVVSSVLPEFSSQQQLPQALYIIQEEPKVASRPCTNNSWHPTSAHTATTISQAPGNNIQAVVPTTTTSTTSSQLPHQDTTHRVGFGTYVYSSTAQEQDLDVTETARRAIHQALQQEPNKSINHDLTIELGVPQNCRVDTSQLGTMPITVKMGGLLVKQHSAVICNVVACVFSKPPPQQAVIISPTPSTSNMMTTVPSPPKAPTTPRRNSKNICSMQLLASVSDELRSQLQKEHQEQQQQRQEHQQHIQPRQKSIHGFGSSLYEVNVESSSIVSSSSVVSLSGSESTTDVDSDNNKSTSSLLTSSSSMQRPLDIHNYKKLPPGVTAKNNKRQFVQHHYHDHAREHPTPQEEAAAAAPISKKPGCTAFPVKLHELLDRIEQDGYGHIMSWIPHGRCFKIHKQKEFLDIVMPTYFVMTKKSSFLRQLNLYGFHRLSAGLDKGAYYHELFLRGMRFLTRRMTRVKVNGNVIRAAGNPDMEPDFYKLPPVPPKAHQVQRNEQQPQQQQQQQVVVLPLSMKSDSPSCQDIATPTPTNIPSLPPAPSTPTQSIPANAPPPQVVLSNISILGPQQASFPMKLHVMLDELEATDKHRNIVSWLPHGRGFIVYDTELFVRDLMPRYFKQTKYSSFQRQLHMYSFQRITAGKDKGAYYHENFLRGMPHFCHNMVRVRINGNGCRKPGDPAKEPDFYRMPPSPWSAAHMLADVVVSSLSSATGTAPPPPTTTTSSSS